MKKVVRLTEADLARMVKQVLSEGGINEGFGRNIGVQMAIWSHLSDIEYDSPEQRKIRCNFIKLLVAKYIPNNVEVNEDKLDALYDQVSNRDFSGSALEDSEMSEMNEQDMAPTSSKPFQIFDDQQERSKSIYSLVAGKGTKRVGFDKEKVEFPVKLLGDSQELITSNAVAQIECVGTYKKIYVFRDNKIIANGYNKAATNYFCNAIRKPLPGTVAPNQKPMMQGGLRQIK